MNPSAMDKAAMPKTHYPVSANAPVLFRWGADNRPQPTVCEFHYPLEIGIVVQGRVRWVFRDGQSIVGPGQVWLCGTWEPHASVTVESPCHRAVLMIHPPMLAETRFEEAPARNWLLPFLVPPRARPQVRSRLGREELLGLARRILATRLEPRTVQKVRLRLLVWETLLAVTRDWRPPEGRAAPPSGTLDRVNRATAAVFASTRRINVQDVSRLCGLGRNRFSRVFRDATGVAFPLFALRFRLSGAAHQLTCTTDPIKAVAAAWDFTDESHFHRTFQPHYGLSPSEYRRQTSLGEGERRE